MSNAACCTLPPDSTRASRRRDWSFRGEVKRLDSSASRVSVSSSVDMRDDSYDWDDKRRHSAETEFVVHAPPPSWWLPQSSGRPDEASSQSTFSNTHQPTLCMSTTRTRKVARRGAR